MLIPSSLMRRIRFSSLRVSFNLITSPRLYLTNMVIASLNAHVFENWKNKQKHSPKTVQIYMGAMGYEKIFNTDYGNNSAAILCV